MPKKPTNPISASLLEAIQPEIIEVCRAALRKKRTGWALDELVQEVNFNLLKWGGNYKPSRGAGFLLRVAENVIRNSERRKGERIQKETEYEMRRNQYAASSQETAEFKEMYFKFRDAMAQLPEVTRRVLIMHMEGKTNVEIAAVFGYTGKHARTFGYRALASAKEKLAILMNAPYRDRQKNRKSKSARAPSRAIRRTRRKS